MKTQRIYVISMSGFVWHSILTIIMLFDTNNRAYGVDIWPTVPTWFTSICKTLGYFIPIYCVLALLCMMMVIKIYNRKLHRYIVDRLHNKDPQRFVATILNFTTMRYRVNVSCMLLVAWLMLFSGYRFTGTILIASTVSLWLLKKQLYDTYVKLVQQGLL